MDWPYAMSASTVAAYLDLGSKSSVYRWVDDGLLPRPHKFRGSARWLRPEIDAALVAHREGEAKSSVRVDPRKALEGANVD